MIQVKLRKIPLKTVFRAALFSSILYCRALNKRVRATVLYATETGKSEGYATQLVEMLGHAFNAKIFNMIDYDVQSLQYESLLFIVTSTFGNGDPPENGENFSKQLHAVRNSILPQKLLINVKFAVFALGSSSYPNFCAFGKLMDKLLGELGAERLMKVGLGDDLRGQEQEFRSWACEVFKKSCEAFHLDSKDLTQASMSLKVVSFTEENTRFKAVKDDGRTMDVLLSKFHNKKVHTCLVKNEPKNLHDLAEKNTILVELSIGEALTYNPGDHVAVFPMNRKELVDGILQRLTGVNNPDEALQLQILNEQETVNGSVKTWENNSKIPACSLRTLLTRFFDTTSPPSTQFLAFLSNYCEDQKDSEKMKMLANDSASYDNWRKNRVPHLLEVLNEFDSCRPPAALFIAHLTPLQPRFYSISSSQKKHPNEVHLTVAVVKYKIIDGITSERYGVCSNYLQSLKMNDEVQVFMRSAPGFHMPKDATHPMILIGPGTGIAPFRSFWQELQERKLQSLAFKAPKVWLFFGCRSRSLDLYREEKSEMVEFGVLNRVFLALSREPNVFKTYVQDLIIKEYNQIYDLIKNHNAHIYVCGDVRMAENVHQTFRKIIASYEGHSEATADRILKQLADDNRYHEDIFGLTFDSSK